MMQNELFGTFGFRGIAGHKINSFIVWLTMHGFVDAYNPRTVVVGTDVRFSGESFKHIVLGSLIECGVNVIDVGKLPTPALQFAVKYYGADAGVMITASHNPPEYNGIKIVDENGVGVSREKASIIEEKMRKYLSMISGSSNFSELYMNMNVCKRENMYSGKIYRKDAIEAYIGHLVKWGADFSGIKIVFDGSSSVGAKTIPIILRRLGAKVLTVNSVEDNKFTWRNPEPSPDNIEYLKKIVVDSNADLGIAVDGDADRTILIDESGNIMQGDKTFALIADYVLENIEIDGWKKGIVTTVATSDIIYDIAEKHGIDVITTKVGDPYVSETAMKNKIIVGGEENGGVIFPWWVPGRDSGMTVVMITRLLSQIKMNGLGISEIISRLPTYYQAKIRIPGRVDYSEVEKIVKRAGFDYDKTDGIKVRTDFGWVLVRNSGTEPIIRVFAESKNKRDLEKMIEIGKSLAKTNKNQNFL